MGCSRQLKRSSRQLAANLKAKLNLNFRHAKNDDGFNEGDTTYEIDFCGSLWSSRVVELHARAHCTIHSGSGTISSGPFGECDSSSNRLRFANAIHKHRRVLVQCLNVMTFVGKRRRCSVRKRALRRSPESRKKPTAKQREHDNTSDDKKIRELICMRKRDRESRNLAFADAQHAAKKTRVYNKNILRFYAVR